VVRVQKNLLIVEIGVDMITKKEAYEAINLDNAKFIEEKHQTKDIWLQTYEYKGYLIDIGAFTVDRWLDDDPEKVAIRKKAIKAENCPW
jgi:hypothetical protein